MVSETFINLSDEKKQKIAQALLKEFSTYPLAKAQVARIVKDAGIARGAFYKYFDDLIDAYVYMYHIAIEDIHARMSPNEKFDPNHFARVVKFIDKVQYSKYEPMMKLHMSQNEYLIPHNFKIYSRQLLNMGPQLWSAMVLSHEVINLCLSDPENQEKVHLVNAVGTENIAKMCKHLDIACMYISTDYVFNGQGTDSWKPDCKDYAPLNVYGQSKLDGELAVSGLLSKYFIVRIAWVFGLNGNNFIKTMLKVGANHDKLTVVNDQIGTPTYTFDLARLLVDMIETDKYGYYHATNEGGFISWYDFATAIFSEAVALGHSEYDSGHLTVAPVTTAEYGISKASRPFNSRLDKHKLVENGFTPLPTWQDALKRYLKEIL